MNDTPQTKSEQETCAHIKVVRKRLQEVINRLYDRGVVHDASKLESPEKEAFEDVAGSLHGITYGSEEYHRVIREKLGPALDHHYANNSHHPEHHDKRMMDGKGNMVWTKVGIRLMSLLDQLEMLADWKAATERHADGSLFQSFRVNRERFGIPDPQFFQLVNTATELGWLTAAEQLTLSTSYRPTPGLPAVYQ